MAFLIIIVAANACIKRQARFTPEELFDLETQFWDNFIYPANLKQAQTITSSLFTPDVRKQPNYKNGINIDQVQGRVDITRNFDGAELNTEYLFGLFSDPNAISLVGIPMSYEITEFVAHDRAASASTIITFNATTFGKVLPVTIDTFIAWNDQRKILQYDATFRWFDWLLDEILAAAASKIQAKSTDEAVQFVTKTLANSICKTAQEHCTGANQQYANVNECLQFLTEKTRFGKAYELGQNTLLCRSVHEQMVPLRPEFHCPHIGPTGGGMCTDDLSYGSVVQQKHFTNAAFVNC